MIGRKGAEVDRIRKDIERYTKKRVDVKVEDMNQAASESRPETDAALLAQGVAEQLAGRVAFRRAMRRARADRDALGRPRRPGRSAPGGSAAPRWAVASGTARAACRCTPSARRSTTAPPRRRPRSGVIGVKVWVYHGDEVPRPRAGDRARAGARARQRAERRTRAAAAAARSAPTPAAEARAREARPPRQPPRRAPAPDGRPPSNRRSSTESRPAADRPATEAPTTERPQRGPRRASA